MAVGITLEKKVGQEVEENEKLATIYANSEEKLTYVKDKIKHVIKIN